jgi:hypothetical protein
VRPASAYRTAHDGTVYRYTAGGGFEYIVPPAGFKPVSASNAVLAEMNLPQRPQAAKELASWKSQMTGYKGTAKPELCEAEHPISVPARGLKLVRGAHGAIPGSVTADHDDSLNWSGYVDRTSTYFTSVVGHWIQNGSDSAGSNAQCTWVGLGGFNSGDLLQDGTAEFNNARPVSFFEYLGAAGTVTMINEAPVNVDDNIAAAVTYNTGTGEVDFGVTDDGTYVVNVPKLGLENDWDGTTGEFIDERPDDCAPKLCFQPLTDYVKTTWTDARVYTSSAELNVASADPDGVIMSDIADAVPPCGTPGVLAYPTDLSGFDFINNWCQPT